MQFAHHVGPARPNRSHDPQARQGGESKSTSACERQLARAIQPADDGPSSFSSSSRHAPITRPRTSRLCSSMSSHRLGTSKAAISQTLSSARCKSKSQSEVWDGDEALPLTPHDHSYENQEGFDKHMAGAPVKALIEALSKEGLAQSTKIFWQQPPKLGFSSRL